MLRFAIHAVISRWLLLSIAASQFVQVAAASSFEPVELFPSLSTLNSRVWWVDYDGDSRIDFAATGVSTNSGQAGDLSFLPGLYSDQGLNQFARDSSVWFRV